MRDSQYLTIAHPGAVYNASSALKIKIRVFMYAGRQFSSVKHFDWFKAQGGIIGRPRSYSGHISTDTIRVEGTLKGMGRKKTGATLDR
ncbi:MAG: hypothetical protein WAM73_02560 [Desulfobacterales bacterium]